MKKVTHPPHNQDMSQQTTEATSSTHTSPLHRSSIHESGYQHVSGKAIYVDDIPEPQGLLYGMAVPSTVARGRLLSMDVEAARAIAGVQLVLTAKDIPGINDISPFSHDEPLLADGDVFAVGQHIAFIVADSYKACREGAKALNPQYEALPAVLDIRKAIETQSYLTTPHVMHRGEPDTQLAAAPVLIEGEIEMGGQDHFYLETHVSLAIPKEWGHILLYSSTQHPSEVQAKTAEVLGIPRHNVTVEVRRLGGGFGGKETQGNIFAALAALGAIKLNRPVKVWLNRDQDMVQTGKRHPFFAQYKAGFDTQGNILAANVSIYSDGGWSADLSGPVLDRAMFHLDNAYYIPALHFEGRVARTNTVSNTAFRGFGGPQGMLVMEEIFNKAAEQLQLDPADLRQRNFYGEAPRDRTPYTQPVPKDRSQRIFDELIASSMYRQRREDIETFNASSKWVKRGIGYQPVKFGISFTNSILNQAGAFVNIYADGSVQLNHGGTEMGQGLHTKMLAVCAHELGVPLSQIRQMDTNTEKVPNTSATAASSGSDLNGAAVQKACEILRERLRGVAAKMLNCEAQAASIVFENGFVYLPTAEHKKLAFPELALQAYEWQVSLSAVGYYRTPDIEYDHTKGAGKPFHYFAYGAAVTEVEVNKLTGEYRVTRTDILHDVGHSLVPSIDKGQIEGAYIQGLGWLTCEELVWSKEGHLRTHSPDTYKIPALGEAPLAFNVSLLSRAAQEDVIHGSKAVGEPPFMLAISVVTALRHAISAFRPGESVELSIPATSESVLRAIEGLPS